MMIIESVSICNMDAVQEGFDKVMRKTVLQSFMDNKTMFSDVERKRLEQLYSEANNSLPDQVKNFGRNLSILLEHASIVYKIKEVSILEAYVLKKFARGGLNDVSTYLSNSSMNGKLFPRSWKMVQNLFTLVANINKDTDVNLKPGALLFPSKSVLKDVFVSFEGLNIENVIGLITTQTSENYFVKRLLLEIQDNLTDEAVSDILIKYFLNAFYSYMQELLDYVDNLSDYLIYKNYLDPALNRGEQVVLSHISVMGISINFLTGDQSNEEKKIKSIQELKNIYKSDLLQRSTKIFITCNAPLLLYFESFLYLPMGTVIESTPFSLIMGSDNYEIYDELHNYTVRIRAVMEPICKERRENLVKRNILDRYNLLMLNSSINFTFKFTLSDIPDIILGWEEKIKTDNIYGKENSYLRNELLGMLNSIKVVAIKINSLLQ